MTRVVINDPKLPEWLRTSFVDDDGRVFLPCGAFGNELTALLCLGHDGEPLVRDGKHVYATAPWLAKEHPQLAEVIDKIAKSVASKIRASQVRERERTCQRTTRDTAAQTRHVRPRSNISCGVEQGCDRARTCRHGADHQSGQDGQAAAMVPSPPRAS